MLKWTNIYCKDVKLFLKLMMIPLFTLQDLQNGCRNLKTQTPGLSTV